MLAIVNGARIWITYSDPQLAIVIALSIIGTVILAKLVGAVLPLLAKKIGFDPAVMASPFITTIVDALSLVVYFDIASDLLCKQYSA